MISLGQETKDYDMQIIVRSGRRCWTADYNADPILAEVPQGETFRGRIRLLDENPQAIPSHERILLVEVPGNESTDGHTRVKVVG